MKKNISINLQGLIFHIEEDGYEVLSRYLSEVRAHFSGYPGHEEIVADIEGRIAELFAARLSPLKQVITLTDVTEMTAKMGRVSEFQSADELDEDELQEAVATGRLPEREPTPAPDDTTEAGPRRLYRDMANRKIAGVAAGIARYFNTNPLWIRLAFLGLLFIKPLIRGIFDLDEHVVRFEGFNLSSLAVLTYIVLWIVLPKKYDATPADEDPTFKKLYRDTDNGKVGGVSAGLAAYFRTDVVVFRLLFVLATFAGFGIPVYIVLWILLPEAKTASDRLRMRGDAVTLSALDSSLRNSSPDTPANRPVGTFLEELFRNLAPLFRIVGSIIRVAAAALLIMIGLSLLVATLILLGAGLGIFTSEQFQFGDGPAYLVLGELPGWFLLSAFLTAFIPALSMLLTGIGLLLRRSVLSRSASLTLLAVWLLSVVGSVMGGVQYTRNFQRQGEQRQTLSLPTVQSRTVRLELRDQDGGHWTASTLQAADSGQVISILRLAEAKGVTDQEAEQTAARSINYQVRALNDSTVQFDNHFFLAPGFPMRDQHLELTIRLPRDRQYRMSRDFAHWLGSEFFVGSEIPEDVEERTFRLTGNRLECIGCPPVSDEEGAENEESTEDGEDLDINIDLDDDVDQNKLNFSTDPSDYSGGQRTFNVTDFAAIDASGAYRIVVQQGSTYRVEAVGQERDLNDLRVEVSGNALQISGRRTGFLGMNSSRKPVLLSITMPALERIELSGACQAKATGFREQGIDIDQTGVSTLILDASVPRLNIDLSGACQATLRGQADELNVEGSGVCRVRALELRTNRADVEVSGASRAWVRTSERLRAEATGASQIDYAGNPSSVEKDASSSSSVQPYRRGTDEADDEE